MLKELVAGVTGLDCTLQVKSKHRKNAIYIRRGVTKAAGARLCRGGLTVNDIEPTSHICSVSMYSTRKVKRGGEGLLDATPREPLNQRVLL